MKTQHTPGPWSISKLENPHHERIIPGDNEGFSIASVSGFDAGEMKANARLIAAAPELLEACKELVADLISHAQLGLNEKEVAMLRRAESAIAKAIGQ